jgi:hypothetical protein
VAAVVMLRPSSIAWQLLPKLRFVQFPWRWMSILTIPFVYFLAAAFVRRRFRSLWIVAAAGLTVGTAVFLVQHTWWDDEEFSTLRAAMDSGQGFDGTDEYDPVGDDHYNLPAKAPLAELLPSEVDAESQAPKAAPKTPEVAIKRWEVAVERWTPEDKIVNVESVRPGRVALRLLNYPAWQVEVNGSRIQPEQAEDSGQMIVPVPTGVSRIIVHFGRTPDRVIGGILSLLSLLTAAAFLISTQEVRRH